MSGATVVAVGGLPLVAALVRSARRADATTRARALLARPRWRLPSRPRAGLARRLAAADLAVEPEAAVELWLAGTAAAGVLLAPVASHLAVAAAGLVLVGGPVTLRLRREVTSKRFVRALPGAVEQIAAALRAGNTIPEALARVADDDGPVAADLRRVRARTALGLGLGDALGAWANERALSDVRAVSGALAVAAAMGGRAAGALDGLAASLRDRLGAAAEAEALSAQARLSALVVGAAPLGYLVFSAVVDPASASLLLGTEIGRVCLVVGLALEAVGALWMRRIVMTEP